MAINLAFHYPAAAPHPRVMRSSAKKHMRSQIMCFISKHSRKVNFQHPFTHTQKYHVVSYWNTKHHCRVIPHQNSTGEWVYVHWGFSRSHRDEER